MRSLVLLLVVAAALLSCEKSQPEKNVPVAINRLVFEFRTDTVICQSGAFVEEYLFQEKYVYLFNMGYCIADGSSPIYNTDGKKIGLIGGWSGWNVNGIPFYANATLTRKVWYN